MILSLRKIKKASLFFCLFCLLLFLLSQLFQLFSTLFPFRSPYQEPLGNAVKVSINEEVEQIATTGIGWLDRLFVFYWIGE
jgi:hypothetical protein